MGDSIRDQGDWTQIDSALADALNAPPDDREAVIRTLLAGRSDLLDEALSLLSYQADSDDDLLVSHAPPRGAATDWIGHRAGVYKITGKAGEGGMGVVWSAVRDDGLFQRQVAVKFLSRLFLAAPTLSDRFLVEAGVLARLNHPNICRLLDAGFTGGKQPYLVMEWVQGRRIDDYVRETGLRPREIVRLFRQVCLAVEHAHRHLVVHSDLKPSNILVEDQGDVKLLDFGIAKMLDRERAGGDPASLQNLILTPDYASPEQLRGEPVSTSVDVYSLGVVFYELLAGKRPFDYEDQPVGEIAGEVGGREPPKPSSMNQKVPRALDAIAMKALAAEPAGRYGSASEFALDLDNFLTGKPLLALPSGRLYVAAKFIRRHWIAFTAALLAFTLVATAGTIALRQKIKAERRFAQLQQLSHSVIFDFQDGIRLIPGTLDVRAQMVKGSLVYLDSLAGDAQDDPRLLGEIARGYSRLAELQGRPSTSNLGDFSGGLASIRKAQRTFDRVLVLRPDDYQAAVGLGQAIWTENEIQPRVPGEDPAGSRKRGIAYWEALARKYPGREEVVSGLAQGMFYLGDFPRALDLYEGLLAGHPASLVYRRNVAVLCRYIGSEADRKGDYDKGLRFLGRALDADEQRVKDRPLDRNARLDLSFDLSELVHIRRLQGNFQDALPPLLRALAIRQELIRMDPKDEQAKDRLLYILCEAGKVEAALRDYRAATSYYDQAIRLGEELSRGGSRPNVQFANVMAAAKKGRAEAVAQQSSR